MDTRLPADFRDEIAKKQRKEIQRLRKEKEQLREEHKKAPGSSDTGGVVFFLWWGG